MKLEITDSEYEKLINKLNFIDNVRNTLLTFSFTAVLTILGVALSLDNMTTAMSWLCLIPFFLIIPFSARIAYYRLVNLHVTSFLKQFKKQNMEFEYGTATVPEGICRLYRLLSWMINHEMLLLGMASSTIFY